MNIIEIIEKKKNNKELSYEEIKYVIDAYLNEGIQDYQMSSLLMAITINGMTFDETLNLTIIMAKSGDMLKFSHLENNLIDKHSTGGVGDKTTLILVPLVAACGLTVLKMSGRGLGHTGGTIDKLESISNFKTNIDDEQLIRQLNDIKAAIISQKETLVPADEKIYALRDVTGTTSSIPLIAASIMSKKIASGSKKIVIDVKVGEGALLNNIEQARELANLMIEIGKTQNMQIVCFLTNMNEPLGLTIGNGLEVIEAIKFLKGECADDLYTLVTSLASVMVSIGKDIDIKEALLEVTTKLETKEAYQIFKNMIEYQEGDIDNIILSEKIHSIKSNQEGFITNINSLKLSKLVAQLGGNRNYKNEVIDLGVGFLLNKKVGDYVLENEELLKVYYGHGDVKIKDILDCFEIDIIKSEQEILIYEIIK